MIIGAFRVSLTALGIVLAAATSAQAQEINAAVPAEKPETTAKPKTPQYSLPWQLRAVNPATGFRSDSTLASYEDKAASGGSTLVSFLTASYKVNENVGVFGRVGAAGDTPPGSAAGQGGIAIANPTLGVLFALPLGGGFKLATSLAVAIPDGSGGGNDGPTKSKDAFRARNQAGIARSQLDGIAFATNDLGFAPAVDLAYVARGFSAQAEVVVPYLVRVEGAKAQQEATKMNFVSGVHLGYFILPEMSVGGEVRYQRWLNAPIAIEKAAANTPAADNIDNLTFAIGPRFHLRLGESVVVRPGVSYSRGLDKPTASSTPNYQMVQLDVPVTFAKF